MFQGFLDMSLELGWVCDHTIYSSIIIETHNFACASCEILVRILCGGEEEGEGGRRL